MHHALKRQGIAVSLERVRKELRLCGICARFRPQFRRRKWGKPLYSEIPGHTVYADFIGPVTPAGIGGHRYIQCIIDSATRRVHATTLHSTHTRSTLKGIREWISRYGQFSVLVTDNDTAYDSREMRRWCEKNGVTQQFIPPHRHQAIGLVERLNRTLIDRLRKVRLHYMETAGKHASWSIFLPLCLSAINNAVHDITGFTPRELWDGTDEMRKLAHERSDKAQQMQDRKTRLMPMKFMVGQLLLIHEAVASADRGQKFDPCWKGVYVLT